MRLAHSRESHGGSAEALTSLSLSAPARDSILLIYRVVEMPRDIVTGGLAGCAILATVVLHLAAAQPPRYDVVLRNGRIVDGTGSPWYRGDVAIRGDIIARIAPSITDSLARVIDVEGQVIAPGFIDLHTHARRGIFEVPTADNYVRQGVTTLMEGPDGGSPVPLGPFLAKLEALQKSVNIGSFIGQGSVRSAVIGDVNREPTAGELAKMRALVEQGMQDGAFGLSSGLFYVPGTFTSTNEVVELAKVAGRFGGIYISHMRDEASGILDSVTETIAIGERGGLPTQLTHHKIIGQPNWNKSVETLRLVDEARARGVDATIDQYPYTASSTSIQAALLPAWALEGGRERTLARLDDPAARAQIKAEAARLIRNERGGGDPKNVRDRELQLGRVAGREEPRRPHAPASHGARRWTTPPRRRCGSSSRAAVRRSSTRSRRGSRADPPPSRDDDRVRRGSADLRSRPPPPSQLRHVRARAGRVRARPARPHARRCRAKDDGVPRAARSASRTAACCGRA